MFCKFSVKLFQCGELLLFIEVIKLHENMKAVFHFFKYQSYCRYRKESSQMHLKRTWFHSISDPPDKADIIEDLELADLD